MTDLVRSAADILNYALTLEHLEAAFYRQGLQNFSQSDFEAAGYDSSFYETLVQISVEENTHVTVITEALESSGSKAVAECSYHFGVSSVETFMITASILEGKIHVLCRKNP